VTHDHDAALRTALVEETCRKSALVWLRPLGDTHAVAAWHVFVDGAVHLVGGGLEQPLPVLAEGQELEVTVRSKDTGGRLLTFVATATVLEPDGEACRWARESTVLRLEPTGRLVESPGHVSHRSHAAEPAGSPATTRGPLPFVVGRRARRRR
jgi:hypothetical protein